jgi:hypothetical protein
MLAVNYLFGIHPDEVLLIDEVDQAQSNPFNSTVSLQST